MFDHHLAVSLKDWVSLSLLQMTMLLETAKARINSNIKKFVFPNIKGHGFFLYKVHSNV